MMNTYQDALDEIDRLRATLLNIQALAERGNHIDNAKLAEQCRRALTTRKRPRVRDLKL